MNKPNQVEIEENFMSNPIPRTVVNYHWLLGFFALWLAFQILQSYFFNSSLNLRGTTTLVFTAMALCCALFFGLTARGIGHRQTSAVRWAKYFHMLIMIVGILGGCISFIGIFSLIFFEPAPSLADHIGRLLAVFFGGLACVAGLFSWHCWRVLNLPQSSDNIQHVKPSKSL